MKNSFKWNQVDLDNSAFYKSKEENLIKVQKKAKLTQKYQEIASGEFDYDPEISVAWDYYP